MELWIRSQNKEMLANVNILCVEKGEKHINLEEGYDIVDDKCRYGRYKTKERALQILDEIENILKPKIKYTKGKINGSFNGVVIRNEDTTEIKEFSTFVYEMPEK